MKMKRILIIVGMAFLLGACGTIQEYSSLEQPKNETLTAGIGENIFLISMQSDLPNAFGSADVWGGKVDNGYQQLVYQGLDQSGKANFIFRNVETTSNETTMSRYKVSSQTMNVQNYGSTLQGTSTTFHGREGQTNYLSPNDTTFSIDPSENKELEFSDVKVVILEATPTSLTYRLID